MVGRYGSLIICGQMEFDDYCIENNILNPYHEEHKIWSKYNKWIEKDGRRCMPIVHEDDYEESDKIRLKELQEMKELYNQQEEKFMIDFILQNGTYEDVIEYCKNNKLTDYFQKIVPCDDSTGQCSFLCPQYNRCGGYFKKEEFN